MQTTEDKVDSSKALDASLVDTESSGTTLKEQDTSSRSGNDSHVDVADSGPIMLNSHMAEGTNDAEIMSLLSGTTAYEQPNSIMKERGNSINTGPRTPRQIVVLLKITLQAPFLNDSDDVCSHQFRPRSSSNDF
ncbi:hypothetical protein Tco_1093001 [Tanacetum coccineum]|uniref:Uncharacterized protein n=1 Tax=Tanacetum coccineum TaxID=301880 RepID=A0ABQ5IBL0_9ASTR